jgi:hypothetical protein
VWCSRLIVVGLFAASLPACGGGGGAGGASPPPPAPSPLPISPAASPFVDFTAGGGIDYQSGFLNPPPLGPVPYEVGIFATGGAAAGDYDNDGDIDLFITRGDIGPNLLYRNDGGGVFTDVAATAGAGLANTGPNGSGNYRHAGPAFADMDGDGNLDLFVGGIFGDPSFIFRNNGDGTFADVTATSGIQDMVAAYNISASFGDYDLDGDIDMFIAHWGTERDMSDPGDTESLWRNVSAGVTIRFEGVSESAGISPSIINLADPEATARDNDLSFAASFARINDDLYPDLVIAADEDHSAVFINNGDGTFDNVTDVGVITDSFGMGTALGDYDDDGDLDWFVTSIHEIPGASAPDPNKDGNRLYRNDNGVFVDATASSGTRNGSWGWGACFVDLENDGDLDIYHTNGYPGDWSDDLSRAFVSNGNGVFAERAGALGLDDNEQGRGVVCADFDRDGDVDILQLHQGFPVSAHYWRNENTGSNNYLAVELRGKGKNTQAAGARIYATIGERTMMREVIIGNNFVSQNPTIQYFGLGASAQVDELRIEWPDGEESIHTGVAAGQTLILDEPI